MYKNYQEILYTNNIIKTDRLILRPFKHGCNKDLEDFFEYRKGSEIVLHQGGKIIENILDAKELFYKSYLNTKNTHIFMIEHKELETIIGGFSLLLYPDDDRIAIGYEFGVLYWGQGYATEALSAIILYSFEKLGGNRVEGRRFDNNDASGRVMEKCGMALEGIHRKKININGTLRDDYIYAILKNGY